MHAADDADDQGRAFARRHPESPGADAMRRRDLLVGAGALGVCGAFACLARSARAQGAGASGGLIDVHQHHLPPFFLAENRERIAASFGGRMSAAWSTWAPERTLEAMDQGGIQAGILSLTSPGVWFGDAQEARKSARRVNDYAAGLGRDHPSRFGLFAVIPLPDTDGSLREIEYALDVLKADGIGLLTSYGDRWLGNRDFEPVFEELNRRKALVFVHPTVPLCCRTLLADVPPVIEEIPQDTARAIANLLYTGTLVKFREIRYIFTHSGGNLPMVYGRMLHNPPKEIAARAPEGIDRELARLHYDIAANAYRPALAALAGLVPASQILFGSDTPFVPVSNTAAELAKFGFSDSELRAIRRENALRLLPRLRT